MYFKTNPRAAMAKPQSLVALGVSFVLACALSSPACAASAAAKVSGMPVAKMTGPGFATAEAQFDGAFAQANAYEFKAGVGLSAFAAASGASSRNASATASGALSDSFRVGDTAFLDNASDTIFLLNFRIRADGSTSSSSTTVPGAPGFQSQTSSFYTYQWAAGGVGGAGRHVSDKLFDKEIFEIHEDSFKGGTLFVRSGEMVNINFSASASAGALSFLGAPGNAATDFDQTLAWDGIASISARDGAGNAIALPDGFKLSLLSGTSGFDYWNAAGRNPFSAPAGVPEPATWAMMLLGFGTAGAILRRRRSYAA